MVATPASIQAFTASATEVFVGQRVDFKGTFVGTGVINPGNVPVQSGVPVSLAMSQGQETFTLSVTSGGGAAVTAGVTVRVNPLPSLSMQPVKTTVTNGGVIALLVAIPEGASLTVQGAPGTFKDGATVQVAAQSFGASQVIQGTVDLGLGLTVPVSATVNLVPAPAALNLVAIPPSVAAGQAVQLVPNFGGGTAVIDNGIGPVVSGVGVTSGPLQAASTFTMTVANAAGDVASASVTVLIVAAPKVQGFSASTTGPLCGEAVTLTAVFSGGTGIIDQGVGPVVSGQPISTGPITSRTQFTLSVTDDAGGTTAAQVVVVPQTVVVAGLPSGPAFVSVGGATQFQVAVNGAASQAVTWFVDDLPGGNSQVGLIGPNGAYQAPPSVGSHVVKAVSIFGASASASVQVIRLPIITSFTVN